MKLEGTFSTLALLFAATQADAAVDLSSHANSPQPPATPNGGVIDSLHEIEFHSKLLRSSPFKNQNLRQRTQTVQEASTQLEAVREELNHVELGDVKILEAARKEGKKYLDQGIEELSTLVQLMHKAELEVGDIKDMAAEKKRRRLSNSEQPGGRQAKPTSTTSSSNPHTKFASFFSDDPMASAMHKKFNKMHDAIQNQDHNHMHTVLKGHHNKATKHRRMQQQAPSQEDENPLEHQKGRQCQILTGCVKGMSFYDTFIYFYSDDIDVKAGTIDNDIIHFDEQDLVAKYTKATELARQLHKKHKEAQDPLYQLGVDSECDDLLQLFHRNIEVGDVPHWEGATVSQVCLAEGSAEFIGLDEIAETVGGNIAALIAEEQLNCAWDLYNSKNRTFDDRYKREPFAFADEKRHSASKRLSMLDMLVPNGLNMDIRDEHGHVLNEDARNSKKRFYSYEAFQSPDLRGLPPKERKDMVKETWKQVQSGFDLAFGEKQSVGFVCGVREGVVNHDQSVPGHCCLDAPYEGAGDEWGRKFECSKECKHPGPFLSGLSDEACSAHGGTWCQAPVNCRAMQQCVDTEIVTAEAQGFMPYATYLKGGVILNPSDAHACGRSLEYFGFDEHYTNFNDVCDNIRQLQNTRNFQDLNEFFNQGSKGAEEQANEEIPSAEINIDAFREELEEPQRDRSATAPVTEGPAWDATNFALEQVFNGVSRVHSAFADYECPDDGWGITWTICSTFKNILNIIFNITLGIFEVIIAISDYTFSELCEASAVDHLEIWENTEAIYANMQVQFKFMDHIWNSLAKNQQELAKAQTDIGDISNDRFSRIDETLAYIVEKLEAMPAPEVTHRPTPVPTARPTSSPTLTPGNTHIPTATPSEAPSVEAFCEPIVAIQSFLDSDFYFEDFGCTDNFPCVASLDEETGIFWMGAKLQGGKGPGGIYGAKVFYTKSLADTRSMLCGLPFVADLAGDEVELQFENGNIKRLDDESEFARCTPKFSLEDIDKASWIQTEWGCSEDEPCIEAKVDEDGRLWMGNPTGHSGYGPGLIFGREGYFHTTSEAETHKLLCGLPTNAMISSPLLETEVGNETTMVDGLFEEEIQMLNEDTIRHGDLTMTRACTPKYTLGDVVDSDWFLSNWKCDAENPCTSKTDDEGRVYIGKAGNGFGPDSDFSHWNFFRTSSAAHTRKLLCGEVADFDRDYELNYIVVSGDKVVDSYPSLKGAKQELSRVKSGRRLIAEVKNGIVVRDPHRIAGQSQKPEQGYNKYWNGWSDINQMMDIAEEYYDNESQFRFLVVHEFKVTGHYSNLDDAKAAMNKITWGQRLIAEYKNGNIVADPNTIDGQRQTPANGFNKEWWDWKQINKLIASAKEYVVIKKGVRKVQMDDTTIKEIKEDGKIGFTFNRGCEPIYSLEDLTKYEWTYEHWKDGRGLTPRIDDDGRFWLGRPGSGYGPDNFYGKWHTFNTENSGETRRLLCGLNAQISWDNGGNKYEMTLLNGNKMTYKNKNGNRYEFRRTNREAAIPDLRMYGPREGTGSIRTWADSNDFCKYRKSELAQYSDYCDAGLNAFGGQKSGNQWSPFGDYENGFVQIGDNEKHQSRDKYCRKHDDKDVWEDTPTWGKDAGNKWSFESNYVLCRKSDMTLFGPQDGTGMLNSYDDAVNFCLQHELVLASYEDYCTKGKTVFGGRLKGDQWAPFSDYPNAWVQMGEYHPECNTHHDMFGAANWGTDNRKETWEANYVLCKPE